MMVVAVTALPSASLYCLYILDELLPLPTIAIMANHRNSPHAPPPPTPPPPTERSVTDSEIIEMTASKYD
jgi:hypothetical protein